ncbi:MAG: hypothetical protein EON61_14220 [Alphaproteobacteria bacterium]|jgi:hypothetical protein|nr:MAG: hypothetical protein EON61_19900 [Alphaproteobacteria bacterium]RYZ05790.1 MAG: hypothetical protein EON61_14220 [Alphaproteobacteria bacterium]
MNKRSTTGLGRLGDMLFYVFGAWVTLTVFILALPWDPQEAFMEAARMVLLFVSAIALLVAVVGAASSLLGVFGGMSVKDTAPKP